MTTGTHTQLLADIFGSQGLESRVILRLADTAQATIRIWPYAVSQNLARKNESLPRASGTGQPESPRDHQRTHVLVLPATIAAYDQARRIVFENPVLTRGDARARVLMEPVPLADMTALFLASHVEYCLALGVVIDEA